MKNILFVSVIGLLISCGKSSVSPSVTASNKADFNLSSHKYIKGDKVSFTNISTGIITFDWYHNGISFNKTIKPSDQTFGVGNHIIELIGITSDGSIYKHLDSFEVYDKFTVSDYRFKNNTNIDLKLDSTKGCVLGFQRTDRVPFGWVLDRTSIQYFIQLLRDSAKNCRNSFDNNFRKPYDIIEPLASVFYVDLIDNCNFIIGYTNLNFMGAYHIGNYNKTISVKSRDVNYSNIILNSGDFDIELKGRWSY